MGIKDSGEDLNVEKRADDRGSEDNEGGCES